MRLSCWLWCIMADVYMLSIMCEGEFLRQCVWLHVSSLAWHTLEGVSLYNSSATIKGQYGAKSEWNEVKDFLHQLWLGPEHDGTQLPHFYSWNFLLWIKKKKKSSEGQCQGIKRSQQWFGDSICCSGPAENSNKAGKFTSESPGLHNNPPEETRSTDSVISFKSIIKTY